MTEPRQLDGSPFWAFSLRLYAKAGVADACLTLQDKQGADINLLFFVLWAGQSERRLSVGEVRALVDLTEDWRSNIVVPLRRVRRALRTPSTAIDAEAAAALRQNIKKAELEAERLQQAALFTHRPIDALGEPEPLPQQAAAANIATYAAVIATVFDPAPVAVILGALAGLLDSV